MLAQTSIGRGEKVIEVQSYPRTPFMWASFRDRDAEEVPQILGRCPP